MSGSVRSCAFSGKKKEAEAHMDNSPSLPALLRRFNTSAASHTVGSIQTGCATYRKDKIELLRQVVEEPQSLSSSAGYSDCMEKGSKSVTSDMMSKIR